MKTRGALPPGAVSHNHDIKTIISDWRRYYRLTVPPICLSGSALLRPPEACLQVMKVTEGWGMGVVWCSRGALLHQHSGQSVKIRQVARASSYQPCPPYCSVFLE